LLSCVNLQLPTQSKLFTRLANLKFKKLGRGGDIPLYPYQDLYNYLKVMMDISNSLHMKQISSRQRLEEYRGRPAVDHDEFTISKLRRNCGVQMSRQTQLKMVNALLDAGLVDVRHERKSYRHKTIIDIYKINDKGKNFVKKYISWVERMNREFN
jgi:predicted transcriptional regulator